MEKIEISAVLEEIADLMEIQGDNPFRVRSFRNGARTVEGVVGDLPRLVEEGKLEEIHGIGETLAGVITELVRTGKSTRLEELRRAVPEGLHDLVAVPGLGPKKGKALYDQLGITSLEALEKACREGKVAGLKGFGKKTEEKILAGIAYRRTMAGRYLVAEALVAAIPLRDYLQGDPLVERVEIAGSLRRWRETIHDVDLVAATRDSSRAGEIMDRFVKWKGVVEVLAKGETKTAVRLGGGLQADLRVVRVEEFPFALQYFTGSKEHNTALRGLARDQGLKLNEYGLFKIENEAISVSCGDEASVYRSLGLDYIPPELRENQGEIELAHDHRLPDLVKLEDLRGIVHVHSTFSDGQATLRDMAKAAQALGFEYLGISDHSQSAGYAGGLKEEAVIRQHREVDELNREIEGFRIFKGIESDIRADGSLDYSAEVLDRFDFVIASIHSGFNLPLDEQTARVLKALEDPHTTILAHPTGRLLLEREGYALHMEKVLEAAGRRGVAVEINAHPLRLDLDWRWGSFARAQGVKTSINPDAHAVAGYGDLKYGVGIARKAGFSAGEVINTYEVKEFENFIRRRGNPSS